METQKKSHTTRNIVLVVILAILIGGALWFRQYYQNRYVQTGTFYAKVPTDLKIKPKFAMTTDDGKAAYDFSYKLTGYDKDGKSRQLVFTMWADMSKPGYGLFPAGTYLKINTSNTIVLGQQQVDKSAVPPNILTYLDK